MKFRKLISGLVVCSLTILVVIGSTAVALTPVNSFADVDSDSENYQAVEYLRNEGVVEGYADGTYKPEATINRAEFLKILMESAGTTSNDKKNCYPDVKEDWYAKYVCSATALGLVQGYPDGKFRPEQEINFAEASKITANALDLDIVNGGDVWYQKFVLALDGHNAVPKTIDSFDTKVTRGEMAEVVWRVKEDPSYVSFTNYYGIRRREVAAATDGALVPFESCVDLRAQLKENAVSSNKYYLEDAVMSVATDGAADDASSVDSAVKAPQEEAGSSEGERDFSETNVQVVGVDEADIVKTDGEYIYLVKGSSVRVVKAHPVEGMVELDRVSFDEGFNPTNLYVDGDKLIVLGSKYGEVFNTWDYWKENTIMPAPDYSSVTQVYILDITDKSAIKSFRKLDFEGDYNQSRKVNGMLYLVMNEQKNLYEIQDNWDEPVIMPLYSDQGEIAPIAGCGDVRYVPGTESSSYMIVAAIPLNSADAAIDKEVVLGGGGNVYASRENLYIAEHEFSWWWGWSRPAEEHEEETVIHKFSLGNDVQYKGKGSVPGQILNQFSMDEYKGNFRIATTIGEVWDSTNLSTNNLYILNENLQPVSNIEGIAPGERIYSVRFMGDRAYMVTFKKVDPFFVIDVADPSNPKILGKLKIPGYSDYLHPFDENHIIGFGKEAVDASEEEVGARDLDFAWYQGMKIAMFDVTDVANPVELHKTVIGDRGTTSDLLYDHKALMWDKSRGVMAFPITVYEISEALKNDPSTSATTYGEPVYQGAYVYEVSVDKGFVLRGRVSQYAENEIADKSGYYWSGANDILRALYIGDVLYTVSRAAVMANDYNNLSELKKLELVKDESEDDYRVIY